MNRKVVKIVSILLIIAMAVTMLSTSAFAAIGDVSTSGDFNPETFHSNDTQTTSVFQGFIGTLINIIQVVGMGVAVIMLVVMAMKYISAAPSEKAEIKKSVMIYVVGAVVLFAASGILQVIKNFARANINDSVSDTSKTSCVEMIDETYLG